MNFQLYKLSNCRGVALFVAVLTASIALAIGAGVMNIVLKQIKLASLGKESMVALFAADTGFECALLWDNAATTGGGIFATTTSGVTGQNKQCVSKDITSDWETSRSSSLAVSTFTLPDPFCAKVVVTRGWDVPSNSEYMTIVSRGYNTCDTGSPKRVERGIEIRY